MGVVDILRNKAWHFMGEKGEIPTEVPLSEVPDHIIKLAAEKRQELVEKVRGAVCVRGEGKRFPCVGRQSSGIALCAILCARRGVGPAAEPSVAEMARAVVRRWGRRTRQSWRST